MPGSPLLTVALPTYNGASHIEAALRGILAQQGPAFQLLVRDDRSDDSTVEQIQRVAGDRARVEINSERLGLAGNWNRCVQASETPWVAVFHQDDVMLPGHLASHVERAEQNPQAGIVASPARAIDAGGAPLPGHIVAPDSLPRVPHLFPPPQFVPRLAVENPLRCSAVSLRKRAHQELGGFHARYRYALDWDFWLRLAKRYPVAWTGSETVAFRWHVESETHTFKTGTADLDEQARLLDELYAGDKSLLGPESDALRRRRDIRLARGYVNRAYESCKRGDRSLVVNSLRLARQRSLGEVVRMLADPRLTARLAWALVRPAAR